MSKSGKGRNVVKTIAAMFFLGVLNTNIAYGAEYLFDTNFRLSSRHNDNISLTTVNPQSETRHIFSVDINGGIRTEIWQGSLASNIEYLRSDNDRYDANNKDFAFNLSQSLERHQFTVSGRATRDTTLESELENAGVISPEPEERNNDILNISWRYSMSETITFSLNAGASENEIIERLGSSRYQDYKGWNASTSLFYQFNEKLGLGINYNYSEYEFEESSNLTVIDLSGFLPLQALQVYSSKPEIEALIFTVDYIFDPINKVNLQIGKNTKTPVYDLVSSIVSNNFYSGDSLCTLLENDFLPGGRKGYCEDFEEEKTDFIDFAYEWSQEVYRVTISYSESVLPSSKGYIQNNRTTSINGRWDITQHSNLSVSLKQVEEGLLGNDLGFDPDLYDSEYQAVEFKFSARINEGWSLSGLYSYRKKDQAIFADEATANMVQLSISYKPLKWQWSR